MENVISIFHSYFRHIEPHLFFIGNSLWYSMHPLQFYSKAGGYQPPAFCCISLPEYDIVKENFLSV